MFLWPSHWDGSVKDPVDSKTTSHEYWKSNELFSSLSKYVGGEGERENLKETRTIHYQFRKGKSF